LYDKRASLKDKQSNRELQRAMRHNEVWLIYIIVWGWNGFDGDIKAHRCMPSVLSTRKLDGNLNIIADDYNYAMAA
jgi:hypothetical protein